MLYVLSILCLLCHMGMLSVKISVLRKSFHSLVASHEGKDDGAWYLNNPFIVYNSFQSCKGEKWLEGPGSIMSDSSHCHHEQSRCHSSNNTLYTDLFSSDKWTRAVSKSQSWIKPLSPKPLFFYLSHLLFHLLTEVPKPHTLVRFPNPAHRLTWMVQLLHGLLLRKSLKRTLEQFI